jgi:rubredoxin
MNKDYRCKKCGNIYQEEISDRFIKTVLRKCPVCGSQDVSLIKSKKRTFANKIK